MNIENKETDPVVLEIMVKQLREQVHQQKNKITSLQTELGEARGSLKNEKLKHAYLNDMYESLLERVIK